MNALFRERSESELKKMFDSSSKKSGVKRYDEVNQRIGRAKQKYPSVQRYYTVDLECADSKVVASMRWSIKDDRGISARSGIYFLRASLSCASEGTVWRCYNTIREIESTFRVLKTDLDLRPIYHKSDDSTMAHLHLGLLAYWVVNTTCYPLTKRDQ